MTIADRRRPFDQHAETQSPLPGDAFSTTAAQPAHSPSCRCRGTGTISLAVPLSGALLLADKPCSEADQAVTP